MQEDAAHKSRPIPKGTQLNEDGRNRPQLIKIVIRRLFIVISVLSVIMLALLHMGYSYMEELLPLFPLVLLGGVMGGFIGTQRRLREISSEELEILSSSWLAMCLPSICSMILAVVLYVLFMTEIIGGGLFPEFKSMAGVGEKGIASILKTEAASHTDVAKLVFWSFLSGYSERFVPLLMAGMEQKGRGSIG